MGAGKGFFSDYPKHVFLILGNEFCERFSFYGMKAILVLFLTRALNFTDDQGTAIYHGFNMACYFMPLFGAMIADGYLGKYKTILIISVVYAIGNIIMAVGAIPFDGGNFIRAIPFIGLILIAVGTGGIKPCVSAFGADQFEDEQVRQKETFFSLFYMAINLGSLMSMIITPIIRSEVTCFNDECYALAFGIPAALMLVAVIFFIAGTAWYRRTPPGENIIGRLFGCIGVALKGKCSCSGQEKRDHWLDYADSAYSKEFIADVKAVMRVLFMFIPLPVFWALFDQQGSRWILQAGQMNGELGFFVLQPDLVQVLNPLLVVIMVPLLESLLFPCLQKFNLPNSPLQRLGVGMFLAGTAFVITGFLQISIDRSKPPVIQSGTASYKLVNVVPCDISASIMEKSINIKYVDRLKGDSQKIENVKAGNYSYLIEYSNCQGDIQPRNLSGIITLSERKFTNVISYWDNNNKIPVLQKVNQPHLSRTPKGQAKIQVFNAWNEQVLLRVDGDKKLNATQYQLTEAVSLKHSKYKVRAGNVTFEVDVKAGAVYTVVLHYSSTSGGEEERTSSQFQDVSPNQVTILLQIPQYFVMSLGEVFFSVTGLSFAYSQAPVSMKAVLQAAWLLTNALGNCIVMIITAVGKLPNQMAEFFLFAGLMYVTVIIFAIMSLTYKYVDHSTVVADDDSLPEKKGIDNTAMSVRDELPPKYDQVAADTVSSTYM